MINRIFVLLSPALVAGFLLPAAALAQTYPGQFPTNTVFGNSTGSTAAPVPGQVINGQLANMAANTIKCNLSNLSASPLDCSVPTVVEWSNATGYGLSTSNSAATNTTNINALISTLAAGAGGNVFIPCGTYPLQSITIPAGSTVNIVGGGKNCTFLQQDAADLANNFLTIGNGTLHGQSDNIITDLTFTATSQKTGNAFIFAKGTDRGIFRHLIMTNGFYGIFLDGVDRHIFEDVQIYSPANTGYVLYEGWDCGFTPATTTTTSSLAAGGTSFTVTSTAGLSNGMNIADASVGGNYNIGTISSIVGSTINLVTGSPQAMANGHTVVFGGTCGQTAATWVKDNWVTSAGTFGVWIAGGLGGITAQGLEVLTSGSHGINIDTSQSHGISNREIFFTSGDVQIDTNVGSNLNVAGNSIGKLLIDGAWFNASTGSGNHSIQVALQRAQVNPAETGAVVRITGTTAGQSNASGLYYADQGTLTVVGSDFSYGFGTVANLNNGITIQTNTGVGTVVISGNTIHNNTGTGAFGIRILGTQPPSLNISNNIITGNTGGAITGFASGTGASIVNNIGYNPVGASTLTTTASPWTYTAGASPETVYVSSTAAITSLTNNGTAVNPVNIPAAAVTPVGLGPGETMVVTSAGGTITASKMVH